MSRRSALVKHVFVPSGRRSYGHRICAMCDGLERDSVHKVAPVPDDVAEQERRRVGETSEVDSREGDE